jgi:hypothetical protein
MATDPELQAQLARLLQDESLRLAPPARVREAAAARFDMLVDGLVAEVAASDDVFDQDSALSFARLRVEALESVIGGPTASRLFDAVQEKIEAW